MCSVIVCSYTDLHVFACFNSFCFYCFIVMLELIDWQASVRLSSTASLLLWLFTKPGAAALLSDALIKPIRWHAAII